MGRGRPQQKKMLRQVLIGIINLDKSRIYIKRKRERETERERERERTEREMIERREKERKDTFGYVWPHLSCATPC